MKTQFKVTGINCDSCKTIIEDIAQDFPEIKKCQVDVESGMGHLEYKEGFDLQKFKFEIDGIGKYKLEFIS